MHTKHIDTAIIGAGAVGSAIAYYLAKAGQKPTLFETMEFPAGSSKRCDGQVVTYDSAPGFFSQLCLASLNLFPTLNEELAYDFHFSQDGLGLLIDAEADLETAHNNYLGKIQEGIAVEWWDQAELHQREPHIGSKVLACLNFKADSTLNPMRLVFGLALGAKRHGASLQPNTEVCSLSLNAQQEFLINTNHGEWLAKQVILSAGIHTPRLGAMLQLDIPIRPRQGQIIVTDRTPLVSQSYAEFGYLAAKGGQKRLGITPAMEALGVAMVAEPTLDKTTLFGSSRRYVGFDQNVHPTVLQAIATRAKHFFPKLAQAQIIRSYAGLRPATPDAKPIISDTPIPGLYLAAGHEGNGIGLCLITGKLITQMLTNQPLSLDISSLNLQRFQKNQEENHV